MNPVPSSNTAQRAAAIAAAAQHFPELGPVSAEILLGLVASELGHREALDAFQFYGASTGGRTHPLRTRAIAPACLLHVVAGNTPIAGLQSLVRGLLIGSQNLVKLPSSGLPKIQEFVATLAPEIRQLVTLSSELDEEWMRRADAIIVFGGDSTVEHFRRLANGNQRFVAHGHAISFGIVFSDADQTAADRAARDIGLYDQQGCLSPHCLYVDDESLDARAFASKLADAMAEYETIDPRSDISAAESTELIALRDNFAFRAATDESVAIWQSSTGSEWTVIFETDSQFAVSPLNRTIYVKPLPPGGIAGLAGELKSVRSYLNSIAVHPFTESLAESVSDLGANRICALGDAQFPHPFWHQDGRPQLTPLINWQDIG